MGTPNILIVDDDSSALDSLARGLSSYNLEADFYLAHSAERAIENAKKYAPDVAVIDLSLNAKEGVESGYRLLQALLAQDNSCRVIVLTGNSQVEFGVRALSLGAANFLAKPANLMHLSALIRDGLAQAALRRTVKQFQHERDAELSNSIIGTSDAAERLRDEIAYAASTGQAIFIRGETGCGKGLCAQLIHRLSSRRQQRFIRYQPLFNSADLVHSELFGHERGAYTGALGERRGLLEEADNGTLFLDEIDELPHETQVSMLGVLHDRTFRRLGDNSPLSSNFRLISASNAIIEERIEKGCFRRDLFHRIAHHQICIPPLRERCEDIEPLAAHIISALRMREPLSVMSLSRAAVQRLCNYPWPGNIRELEAVIEGAAWRAQRRSAVEIDSRDIHFHQNETIINEKTLSFHERVQCYEEELVKKALNDSQGSLSAAARALGIDRGTVKRIVERSAA